MPVCKTELEVRLYSALKRIAKDYDSAERLLRQGEREYGISGEEVLEMAYENLQHEAKCAIKGVRLPRAKPARSYGDAGESATLPTSQEQQ